MEDMEDEGLADYLYSEYEDLKKEQERREGDR